MGCDLVAQEGQEVTLKFQSTHPHGVRLTYSAAEVDTAEFQSTHPHGVRLHIQQKVEYHDAKVCFLRELTKNNLLKVHKGLGNM